MHPSACLIDPAKGLGNTLKLLHYFEKTHRHNRAALQIVAKLKSTIMWPTQIKTKWQKSIPFLVHSFKKVAQLKSANTGSTLTWAWNFF